VRSRSARNFFDQRSGTGAISDWSVKESVRVIVKRILRKYGYLPDKQESATNTVLQQAELLSDFWTEETIA